MAYLSTTVNWDSIRAITNPKVSQKIADNITGKIPLLYFMNRMGHKEYEDGGYNYVQPVFKELATAQAYKGNTVLNTVEADPATVAIYERKQLTVPIVATGTKMLQNSGNNPEAVVNYMAFIVEAAEESMKNSLGGSSIGIFSSLGEGDDGVTGLQNMVVSTNTVGTVGGLSRATYLWWRNQIRSMATGWNTDGLTPLRALYILCVRGDEAPTVGITTQLAFANLERSLVGTLNYQGPTTADKMGYGDAGFQTLNYHGTPIMFDSGVPVQTFYLLNLKYMKLLVHRDRDMSIRDWITPTDQDSIVARIYWAGNLMCANLSRQGIMYTHVDDWL